MLRVIFLFVLLIWSQAGLTSDRSDLLNIGVITNDKSETVISMAQAVSPDDKIYLYRSDATAPAKILNGSQLKAAEPDLRVSNFDSQGTVLSYALKGPQISTDEGYYGFALVFSSHSAPKTSPQPGRKEGYIALNPGSGDALVCTSSEGVSVYARSSSGINHIYYALGYDVEPTCPDYIFE